MLVADINFGLVRSGKMQHILQERGHYVREMDRIWQREEEKNIVVIESKLLCLREKVRVCDSKLNALEERLRAKSAIITFNSERATLRAIELFSPQAAPQTHRFKDVYVQRAPHP